MKSDTTTTRVTARGDREARRRDVLDSARAILEESGWEGLGIRAIAARAGVSSGAVYQWFSGKEEIFGQLYKERLDAGIEHLAELPADVTLEHVVDHLMRWVIDIWETLGRYELEFVDASTGRGDRTIGPVVGDTYNKLGEQVDALLDEAAGRSGVVLVDSPHRITWFWGACIGVAERLLAMPNVYRGVMRESLITFSIDAVTASLIRR